VKKRDDYDMIDECQGSKNITQEVLSSVYEEESGPIMKKD